MYIYKFSQCPKTLVYKIFLKISYRKKKKSFVIVFLFIYIFMLLKLFLNSLLKNVTF